MKSGGCFERKSDSALFIAKFYSLCRAGDVSDTHAQTQPLSNRSL